VETFYRIESRNKNKTGEKKNKKFKNNLIPHPL